MSNHFAIYARHTEDELSVLWVWLLTYFGKKHCSFW